MTESARGDVLAWVGVSYPLRGNKGLVDKTWRRRRLVCGRRSNLGVTTMVSDLGPPVMVNGLPGNMATEVAEAVLRRGLRLVPFALTGPGVELQRFVVGGQTIALVKCVGLPRVWFSSSLIFSSLHDFRALSEAGKICTFSCRLRCCFFVLFLIGVDGGDRVDVSWNKTYCAHCIFAEFQTRRCVECVT
mmetsp:Transcript_10492/g.21112  ORF Transcript_10492/g.21112 Transcript_10492/m.21112 type:complete len:189 (+) Transcript_10492:1744-2310(+)